MNEILIPLTIFYFIPVVISIIVDWLDRDVKTVGDLMEHFWIHLTPCFNIIFIVFVITNSVFESNIWVRLSVSFRTKWEKFKNIKIK